MKLIKTFVIIILALLVIFAGKRAFNNLINPSNIRAFGDLKVDFGNPPVAPGDPVFTVSDFKPGDCEEREINVTNDGVLARMISVKGKRTGGEGINPSLEEGIYISINNIHIIYGGGSDPKTVQSFFNDSLNVNGIKLGIIFPGLSEKYLFKVCFPKEAGNNYQKKSVLFDLIFGIITSDHLVINEVYYWPDIKHGTDGLKDCTENNKSINKNTGAGSVNSATIINTNNTKVTTKQNAQVINILRNTNNTGGNTTDGNSTGSSVISGNANSNTTITNNVNNSTTTINCGKTSDEWIELFNPTDHDINLKNYTIEDNYGKSIINSNKIIKAGSFALIAKSASTWKYWKIPKNTLLIELGNWIGNGLDNNGDHLILRNPSGQDIDNLGWGTDTMIGVVHVSGSPLGYSLERKVPGLDTNNQDDIKNQFPPTPGQ